MTGNTTLNGSLTQSVGGVTKFSVDTSGNTSIGGTLTVSGNTTHNCNNLFVVTTTANFVNNTYLLALDFDVPFTNGTVYQQFMRIAANGVNGGIWGGGITAAANTY